MLRGGRIILAKGLANSIGGTFNFYVSSMVWGNGGTVSGTPRFVDDTRSGLFGTTVLSKGVIVSLGADVPNSLLVTSVASFGDANGSVLNEMALVLQSGDYFSLATFGDITKSSNFELIFSWSIVFV